MPIRWAIASGNWSNSAIWNDGLGLPTASDDVAANGFTVTIDQNINVLQLRTLTTGSAASGGGFVINDNYTITANINSGTTNCLTFNSGSNGFTINGDIDTINNNINIITLIINGSGVININGAIKRTTGANGRALININSASTINISGSISPTGSAVSQQTIVVNAAGTTLNLTGPVITPPPLNNVPIILLNNLEGTININGNISTTYTTNPLISLPGIGSIITVTGSVTTNGTTGGQLVSTANAIQVYISGSLTAGTTSTISLTGNSQLIVRGPISSSISASGVISTGTGATNLFTGPFYNTGSFNAVYAYRMQMIEPTSTTWQFDTETAGVSKTLYTSNQLPGVPQQTDVRKGTQYNFGLTGSLAMPDPTVVKNGVATDNTTGFAIFTAEDMFNVATQNLTDSGSIGNLLTGASTIQTVGATISSFKV
jgi:hypothetical protein